MKILFITHDTSRTGAPMVLLHFLKWLKENKTGVVMDVLALQEGGMQQEFINVSHSFFDYRDLTKKEELTFFQRISLRINLLKKASKEDFLIRDLAQKNYDFVYANTIVSLPIGREIVKLSSKALLIAHIHELDTVIKQQLPSIEDYLPFTHKVIVPSKLVADSLNENWNFPSEIINTVYECAHNLETAIHPVVSKPSFTIGASGFVHWRKGYDIFIQLARYIVKNYKAANIYFVWVGRINKDTKYIIDEDLRKLGIKDRVNFIGEVANPTANYSEFDVFVMTSREDPFPLVCIEVGQLGKPIISFDQATGTNEILSFTGGGFIVPYLDVEAMAEKVMLYYHDPNLKDTHGAINKEEFSKFTPAIICPQIFSIIEEQL
ncbi:glycosyltransferase [Xanthomarina gelatinilytica]|uniref:glycosyltransferase n=1 Tax=Xanthomarina gelatinilytica TaxID=1137281 RepID=UPI003AA7F0E1